MIVYARKVESRLRWCGVGNRRESPYQSNQRVYWSEPGSGQGGPQEGGRSRLGCIGKCAILSPGPLNNKFNFLELQSQPEDIIQTQVLDGTLCVHQSERNRALCWPFCEPRLGAVPGLLT